MPDNTTIVPAKEDKSSEPTGIKFVAAYYVIIGVINALPMIYGMTYGVALGGWALFVQSLTQDANFNFGSPIWFCAIVGIFIGVALMRGFRPAKALALTMSGLFVTYWVAVTIVIFAYPMDKALLGTIPIGLPLNVAILIYLLFNRGVRSTFRAFESKKSTAWSVALAVVFGAVYVSMAFASFTTMWNLGIGLAARNQERPIMERINIARANNILEAAHETYTNAAYGFRLELPPECEVTTSTPPGYYEFLCPETYAAPEVQFELSIEPATGDLASMAKAVYQYLHVTPVFSNTVIAQQPAIHSILQPSPQYEDEVNDFVLIYKGEGFNFSKQGGDDKGFEEVVQTLVLNP